MSENVGFAGQIGPEHVGQVVEKAFKSIINNRPDMEGGPEQPTSAQIEEAARQAGLDYVYQPVVAGQITELDVRTLQITIMNFQNRSSCSAVLETVQIIFIN